MRVDSRRRTLFQFERSARAGDFGKAQFCAYNEAQLLLREYKETGNYMTDIANKISERINQFTYQLLNHLDPLPLSNDPQDPLIKCYLSYCLPMLRKDCTQELLSEIPDHHKKAIIACHVGSQLVYQEGLHWFPSIVDILPLVFKEIP